MTNSKKNCKPTSARNNPPALAVKNMKAREAALLEKKAAASNTRGRGRSIVADVNDKNVNSTGPSKPRRCSSRLNGTTPGTTDEAPETGSNTRTETVFETPDVPPTKRKAKAMGTNRHNMDDADSYIAATSKSRGAKNAQIVNAKAGHKISTRSPTAENEDTELDTSGGLNEIQELRRLLQQEKGELPRYILTKSFEPIDI
jgi:hypothetical protein